jgi:type IX secretion system PorP/SprF family membrane protein
MRYTICFILVIFLPFYSSAQQLPNFRTEIYAPQWHNPASVGTWNQHSLNLLGYSSGVNFAQASAGGMFSGESFLGFSNKSSGIGLGANYFYTSFSNYYETHTTNFQMNYQFEFDKFTISVGAAPGFRTVTRHHIDWITFDTIPDPNLPTAGSQTKFTLGAGIFLYTDKFYLGLSSSQLNAPNYEEINFQGATTYYVNGGYRFKISDNMQLFPAASFAYYGSGFSHLSGNLMLQFLKPGFSIGAGYAARSNVWGIVGYEYKRFSFLYTAGTSFSKHTNATSFNQEVRLNYKLRKKTKCSTCEYF